MKNIAVDVHTSEHVRIGQANFGMKHSQWSTIVDRKLCIRKHYKLTNLIIAEWIEFLCCLTFTWSSNIQAIDSWIQAELVLPWKKWEKWSKAFLSLKRLLRATWRAEKEEKFSSSSTECKAINSKSKKQARSFFVNSFSLFNQFHFLFILPSTHNSSAPQQFASWSYDLCLTFFDCYSFIFSVFSMSRKEKNNFCTSSLLILRLLFYAKPKNPACKDFLSYSHTSCLIFMSVLNFHDTKYISAIFLFSCLYDLCLKWIFHAFFFSYKQIQY